MERNDSVDALRIVAGIGVIALHVGSYEEFDPLFSDIVRSLFRWCVPFFFMVTGYYLAKEAPPFPKVDIERLRVPFVAYLIANLVFLPLLIAQSGLAGLSLSTLVRGAHGHLWYLTALILALLTLYFCAAPKLRPWVYAFASGIVLAYLAINYHYARTGSNYELVMLIREFSGIPCILLGGFLRANPAFMRSAARWALPLGLVLLAAEIAGMRHLGWRPSDAQFLLSSLFIPIGLLALAIQLPTLAPRWMGTAGKQDGFAIYLYHPIGILITASLMAAEVKIFFDEQPSLALWIGGAVITIVGLRLLASVWPAGRILIEGGSPKKPTIAGLETARS